MLKLKKKEIILKINREFKYYKKYKNPYKLTSKFEKIPNEIIKKILRNNLKLKKCTI